MDTCQSKTDVLCFLHNNEHKTIKKVNFWLPLSEYYETSD